MSVSKAHYLRTGASPSGDIERQLAVNWLASVIRIVSIDSFEIRRDWEEIWASQPRIITSSQDPNIERVRTLVANIIGRNLEFIINDRRALRTQAAKAMENLGVSYSDSPVPSGPKSPIMSLTPRTPGGKFRPIPSQFQ